MLIIMMRISPRNVLLMVEKKTKVNISNGFLPQSMTKQTDEGPRYSFDAAPKIFQCDDDARYLVINCLVIVNISSPWHHSVARIEAKRQKVS